MITIVGYRSLDYVSKKTGRAVKGVELAYESKSYF